jgi:hypothetical protein
MLTKNYKVKCVGYKTSERYFKIGKVYDVVDNKITSDNGFTYRDRKNVIDWLSPWYEFKIVNESDCNIEKVIFNDPATIVIWDDGTKTVVKCQEGDKYNAELGLAMCISKKYFGNKGNFNEVFKKWVPEYSKVEKKFYFSKAWRILKENLELSVCEGYELGYDKESDNDKKQNGMFYAYNYTLDLMKALEEV